jgi:hypothetical protein
MALIKLETYLSEAFDYCEINLVILRHKVGLSHTRYGNCAFDLQTKNRKLPFSEPDFEIISKHLQLPQQFLPAMRVWTCCAFKFRCPPTTHSTFKPAFCIYQPIPQNSYSNKIQATSSKPASSKSVTTTCPSATPQPAT